MDTDIENEVDQSRGVQETLYGGEDWKFLSCRSKVDTAFPHLAMTLCHWVFVEVVYCTRHI